MPRGKNKTVYKIEIKCIIPYIHAFGEHYVWFSYKNNPQDALTVGEHLSIIISINVPQKEKRQCQQNIAKYRN